MIKELFSIEEKRVSALIVGFFLVLVIFLALAVLAAYTRHQVPEYIYNTMGDVLTWLVIGVVGGGAVTVGQSLLQRWQEIKTKVMGSTTKNDENPAV